VTIHKAKSAACVTAVLLMVLAVSGCGLGGPAHGPASNAAAVVDLGFTSFSPPEVTVAVGDTVEWRNKSLITHTVTDDPKRAEQPGDARVPAGAQVFDSGNIPAGQVYRQTFMVPGRYRYFCTHHESEGMVGTVVVKPAQ
jgi:plastocyanin